MVAETKKKRERSCSVIPVTDFVALLCYTLVVASRRALSHLEQRPSPEANAPTCESKEGKMATQSLVTEMPASQKASKGTPQPYSNYACPTCKRPLEPGHEGLDCSICSVTYPIRDEIPDFLAEKLAESPSRDLRIIGKWDSSILFDFLAYSYEACIYPPVCSLFGGWRSTSLKELARDISGIVGSTEGAILDVACGPATYGRRIASTAKAVYGIDICMSMLRRGARYVQRDRVPNLHFARAKIEALPFPAGLFDAAICAGALNHFPDTVLALREVNRTMKAGAPLAVMCFVFGPRGLVKYRFMRDRVQKKGGHLFELSQLERYVAEAGFEGYRSHAHGSILVFSARKRLVS